MAAVIWVKCIWVWIPPKKSYICNRKTNSNSFTKPNPHSYLYNMDTYTHMYIYS